MDAFGPYFAVAVLDEHPDPAWVRLPDLMEPGALEGVVMRTHASLLTREQNATKPLGRTPADLRAVASTVSLGLFSRLLSPSVGAELAGVPTLVPDLRSTWLRQGESGPGDLGTSTATTAPSRPEEHLEQLVLPLLHRFADEFGVPDQVLRGNLAAAVVGACDVVAGVAPSLKRRAAAVRSRLLDHDVLVGTGTTQGPFVRTSCCLIHRLPVGFVCGNCPLVASETPTARRLQGLF